MRKATLASKRNQSVPEGARDDETEQCDLSIVSDTVGFLIRACQVQIFRGFYHEFSDLGLTPGGYATLAIIGANPGVRQGFVAGLLAFREPNMTKLMKELVAAGLVERTPLPHDGRAMGLRLTTAGKTYVRGANARALQLDRVYTDMLDEEERATLLSLLKRMLKDSHYKKQDIEFHE